MGSCVGFRKDDGPVVGEPVLLFFVFVCLFVLAGHWAYVSRMGVAPSLPV